MAKKTKLPAATIDLMRKMLAMPPKPHEEMKVGRASNKKRGPKGRASSAKRDTA